MKNTKTIILFFMAGVAYAGQLPRLYLPESTSWQFAAYNLPAIKIKAEADGITIEMAGEDSIRLHERPGFDFKFPFQSPPDVRALETPNGLCISVYLKMVTTKSSFIYITGGDIWIYEFKESGNWLHWATGETSSETPGRIQAVLNILREGNEPTFDPFEWVKQEALPEIETSGATKNP